MYCHIVRDKSTGQEMIIPGECQLWFMFHIDIPHKELIKQFCTCKRHDRWQYETRSKTEVLDSLNCLKDKLARLETIFEKLKNGVDMLTEEVYMLNNIEIVE